MGRFDDLEHPNDVERKKLEEFAEWERRRKSEFNAQVARLHPMVMRVLRELRDRFYREGSIRTKKDSSSCSWIIEVDEWDNMKGFLPGRTSPVEKVSVEFDYNVYGDHFHLTAHIPSLGHDRFESEKCLLTEEDLVRTLRSFFETKD